MNLTKWENNQITISPEAMGIKVFRDMWRADRDRSKSNALLQFNIMYFMYDPRSDYQIETDPDVRWLQILEETGIGVKWKPDKLFEAAIPVYVYFTNTTSAKALASNRKMLAKVDSYMDGLEVNEDNMDKILKTISLKSDLAVKIAKDEKEIYKDVEEYSAKMRGSKTKTIGDDGLKGLYNGEE